MPRSPITCVFNGGESFRCTRSEADEVVRNGLGEWDGVHTVRMKPPGRSGTRLSLRVGARLASAVHRGEVWARVMLSQIERRGSR
jgi:hypothetical protein